jgi:hypothetical protein
MLLGVPPPRGAPFAGDALVDHLHLGLVDPGLQAVVLLSLGGILSGCNPLSPPCDARPNAITHGSAGDARASKAGGKATWSGGSAMRRCVGPVPELLTHQVQLACQELLTG